MLGEEGRAARLEEGTRSQRILAEALPVAIASCLAVIRNIVSWRPVRMVGRPLCNGVDKECCEGKNRKPIVQTIGMGRVVIT